MRSCVRDLGGFIEVTLEQTLMTSASISCAGIRLTVPACSGSALQQGRRDVVPVLDAALSRTWLGVMRLPRSSKMRPARRASDFVRDGLVVVHLFGQLGLDGLEQVSIDDGGLLASQDLALEDHLADVEAVAEQMGERTACEGNAADGLACLQRPDLGDDASLCAGRPSAG